jgi:phosphoribosylformimino-5-aminoimidazole carboxamide ribotide isomerase
VRAIPAIDIMDGECVRLIKGDYAQRSNYGTDPAAVALTWQSKGAELIHVVDLDGARAGHPVNAQAISGILETVSVPIEVGGGIRSFETASHLLGMGVRRIVLGTAAVTEPELVKRLIDSFSSDRVVVGIDARGGQVATSGWLDTHTVKAADLAKTIKSLGVTEAIYTDIDKDGMMSGPSVEATRELAVQSGLSVIASGGVSSLDDLVRLKAVEQDGVTGVIIGKALYEGAIMLEDAIRILADDSLTERRGGM